MPFKRGHIPWNKGQKDIIHHSEESRRKMSEAGRNRHPSNETRIKLSNAKKGIPKSEETRRKLSNINKGKHLSEETKRKIGNAHIGRKNTEETKLKMSESRKKLLVNNPELRISIGNKQKGKIISKETREKMSKSGKGRPSSMKGKNFSEGVRKKMSEAQKKRRREHPEKTIEYFKNHPEVINNLLNTIIQRPTKPQSKLFGIIKQLYPNNHVESDWRVNVVNGWKFIDVAIPELKLGWEFDGPAFHGGFRGSKEKDLERHRLIESEGWKLTHYSNESEFPKT